MRSPALKTEADRRFYRFVRLSALYLSIYSKRRRFDSDDAHALLVRLLFLCLCRCVFSLPNRQSNLPARSSGTGNLLLLRHLPSRRLEGAIDFC